MSTRLAPRFPWLEVAALCLACFFAGFLVAASWARGDWSGRTLLALGAGAFVVAGLVAAVARRFRAAAAAAGRRVGIAADAV